MTVLSTFRAAESTALVLSGDQTLSGVQSDSVLVKGDLTVSGGFYVPGNLWVEGDLIFNSPTLFTVRGNLVVGGRITGTAAGPVSVAGDAAVYSIEPSLGARTVATTEYEPYATATTVGTPTYDGMSTTVTLSAAVATNRTIVRKSPFTVDVFIDGVNSPTEVLLSGNQTANFPDGTAIRLYYASNATVLTFNSDLPAGTNFVRLPDSTGEQMVSPIAANLWSIGGNVVSALPVSTSVNCFQYSLNNYPGSNVNFGNSAVAVGNSFTMSKGSTLTDASTITIGDSLIGSGSITLAIARSTAYFTGTSLTVNGDVKGFTEIDLKGYSSSSQNACGGGSITVNGSVYGPSSGGIIRCNGGNHTSSGAFNGGSGGNIRINGMCGEAPKLYTFGGNTSGTGTAGAGGTIYVGGPITSLSVGGEIQSNGGNCSLGNNPGGAGGAVTLKSMYIDSASTITASGGSGNTSSTTSSGGSGGTVIVSGRANGNIISNGGNGGLAGGAAGAISLAGPLSSVVVTSNGGPASNTAVANRTGGVGGNVTVTNGSGRCSVTCNGGNTTGGTQTGCVGGNGGIINISGNLRVNNALSNGGSSLTTASSFAGQPGEIILDGSIFVVTATLRTTPQSGVSGTTPTLTGNRGWLSLSGNINIQTLDVTNNSGSRIQAIDDVNIITNFSVMNLTTRNTLTDTDGNTVTSTQATLCKSRTYRYDHVNAVWQAVTATNVT